MAKCLSLIGIFVPFIHTKKFIKDLLYFNISETCIKHTCLKIGNAIYQKEMLESKYALAGEKIEIKEPVDQLYIQADGAMVPIRGEEKIDYKENKLGVVFSGADIEKKISKNGKERVTIHNKRFVSSVGEGVEKFKKMLFNTAKKRGLLNAKVVIFLSDGAVWLRNLRAEYFPNAIQILDWYHAIEHLWTAAHKLFGENNKSKCENWIEPLKELLWNGKILEVIDTIKIQAVNRKQNQTPLWELYHYFNTNKEFMQYDKFREKDYYIGSGVIESANKYIVANRLKQAGMRWSKIQANAMIWLRCKYFEDIWETFWDQLSISKFLSSQLLEASG